MSEAAVPDRSGSTSVKLVAPDGIEHHKVDTDDSVGDRFRLELLDVNRHQAPEWMGPVAFARACGAVPGIDHDIGIRWGSNGDQRFSLRVELGSDAGLLYVYDPTWDEYAVFGSGVPLASVEDAFARSVRLGDHPSVEDFVALLPNVLATRPSPGPEL